MATATQQRNREDSPLLRLPGELRNKIYALVLYSPSPVRIIKTPFYADETRWTPPSLMTTSSQLHAEAGEIYLSSNTFAYWSCGAISRWLHSFQLQHRRAIGRLVYDDGCWRSPEMAQCRLEREMKLLNGAGVEVAAGDLWVKVVFFPKGGMMWSSQPRIDSQEICGNS